MDTFDRLLACTKRQFKLKILILSLTCGGGDRLDVALAVLEVYEMKIELVCDVVESGCSCEKRLVAFARFDCSEEVVQDLGRLIVVCDLSFDDSSFGLFLFFCEQPRQKWTGILDRVCR